MSKNLNSILSSNFSPEDETQLRSYLDSTHSDKGQTISSVAMADSILISNHKMRKQLNQRFATLGIKLDYSELQSKLLSTDSKDRSFVEIAGSCNYVGCADIILKLAESQCSVVDTFTQFTLDKCRLKIPVEGAMTASMPSIARNVDLPVLATTNLNLCVDVIADRFGAMFEIPNECGEGEVVYLLNRLDSATSGIILMATDAIVAKKVKVLFAQREVSKVYKAIVFCDRKIEANEKSVFWEDPMHVKKINGKNRATQSHSSQPPRSLALTDVTITDPKLYGLGRKKSSGKNMMLLELKPKTGYTHQLRYQCALHDFPIVGDKIYGNFKLNRSSEVCAKAHVVTHFDQAKSDTGHNMQVSLVDSSQENLNPDFKRLFLHSYSIEFQYEHDDQLFNFRAVSKLPADFIRIIDNSYTNFS